MKPLLVLSACAMFVFSPHAQAKEGLVGSNCKVEIAKYCADVDHGSGAARQCLTGYEEDLSDTCRVALMSVGSGDTTGISGETLKPNDIVTKLKSVGYRAIVDVEQDGGHYEAKATSPDGHRVEVYVDAFTGKIIGVE